MKITGVITEYNPFHNGHKLHLQKTKELCSSDAIISIMSGNFVQRGLPACLDKWTRAEMAIANGVDLVLELPTVYAVSSAEFFSFGAISTLEATGVVDSICFGSECGNIDSICSISSILSFEDDNLKKIIKEKLSTGLPFPKAREEALISYMSNSNLDGEIAKEVMSSSNNILGIEYVKSLNKLSSNIKPYTIPRTGSNYNDEIASSHLASATSIRKIMSSNDISKCSEFMTNESFNILDNFIKDGKKICNEEMMFDFIKYKIISDKSCLENIPDVTEGLDNKIINEIIRCNTLDELIMSVKSKRYTYTRISRILCQLYLGFDKYDIKNLRKKQPEYIRVLGFNERGREILKMMKTSSKVPVITKLPRKIDDLMLKIDINSTNLYSFMSNSIDYAADYLTSPIFKK